MRTAYVVVVILALGAGFAIVNGAIGAEIFGMEQPTASEDAVDRLGDEFDPSPDDEDSGPLQGEVGGDEEPTLVGLAINAGGTMMTLVGSVVLLPATLVTLGMHPTVAVPLGLLAQIVAVVGAIQFTLGRVYR